MEALERTSLGCSLFFSSLARLGHLHGVVTEEDTSSDTELASALILDSQASQT